MDANDRRSSQNENGMQNVGRCAPFLKFMPRQALGIANFLRNHRNYWRELPT
jgi:hypothetical protein